MIIPRHKIKSVLAILLIPFAFTACNEEPPPSIFDQIDQSNPPVIITAIAPLDSALAGVGELTITGENFSPDPALNQVFFESTVAEVIAATETQLVIKTPNLISNFIQVKAASFGSRLFSNIVTYKLNPAVQAFGTLEEPGEDIVLAFGLAVDLAENVFTSIQGDNLKGIAPKIKSIAPDGATAAFAETSFLKANNLKMGPGNTLYAAAASGRLRVLSTFVGGTESRFVSLPGPPQDFDFDANGNIWLAILNAIHLVKPDGSRLQIDSYPVNLLSVRVYDGFVYVVGGTDTEAKIWRSEIQGESLGAQQVVLEVTNAGWLEGASVLSFTFSENGDLYLGTTNTNGIFIYRTDGTHEILYPGLIEPNVSALSWGEGQFLYALIRLNDTTKLLKIDTGIQGAPYYGRR